MRLCTVPSLPTLLMFLVVPTKCSDRGRKDVFRPMQPPDTIAETNSFCMFTILQKYLPRKHKRTMALILYLCEGSCSLLHVPCA